MAFWRFAASEFDEMGFGVAVEFAFVLAVELAAINRPEPSFGVVLADIVDSLRMAADVLTDCRISEPVVSFQKDACACVVLRSPFIGGNEPFQCLTIFLTEIDDVFLPPIPVDTRSEKITVYCHG
ncbi:hypothetical protein VB773_20040 [Haloarculaceae archaeon H-GB2-1]|nr:hypothetical protein [Haloarculaceae archaeon H-GB1-1]MEA5409642.1 hypothetical protein [Haloarculaceae archaeon H-GB2-1]